MKFKYTPYSASKIKKFIECPRLFKYKYVDKIKVPFVPRIAFEKGNFFHYALEKYPAPQVKPFNFNLSKRSDIIEYGKQLKTILNTPEIKELLTTDERNVREQWLNIMDTSGRIKVINGKIDYLRFISESEMEIIDWKTGKQWGNDATLEDPQILIYVIWAFKTYPEINRIRTSYYYIERDEKVSYTFEREKDYEPLKQKIFNLINSIESEENFVKTEHRFCHYCDYYNICQEENHE